jgi:N-acetylmuramoyl-L-alanine amidase
MVMQPIKVGDSGGPVRDIQDRLFSLGHDFSPDTRGEFGTGSEAAVASFQTHSSLPPTGEADQTTWRRLVQAGYELGDRVIYHRRPMLRGHDVANLQQRLNELGFDAGVVDGIFGPDGAKAVTDFQANRALSEDGIAGPIVLSELTRLRRNNERIGKDQAMEREWLRRVPHTIVGTRVLFDPACNTPEESTWSWEIAQTAARILKRHGGVPLFSRPSDAHPDALIRASRANHLGSEIVISVELVESGAEELLYFDSTFSYSSVGKLLAGALGQYIRSPVTGAPDDILRRTRAPAVIIRAGATAEGLSESIIAGVEAFFDQTPPVRANQSE